MRSADIEGLIRVLEDRRYEAVVDGDVDRLETLLHDQLVYSHSTGVVERKAEMLARLRSGYYRYVRVEHPIDEVVVVGGTALVLLRMAAEVAIDGELRRIASKSLAVWVDDGGAWRLIAFHPTPL